MFKIQLRRVLANALIDDGGVTSYCETVGSNQTVGTPVKIKHPGFSGG